jgi:hypothetical protein
VFFRAASLGTAMDILRSMAGAHGVAAPRSLAALLPHLPASQATIDGGVALGWAMALLGITWLCPNTQQVMRYEGPGSSARTTLPSGWTARLVWSPAPTWAGLTALLFAICVMKLSHVSEFIYFQF